MRAVAEMQKLRSAGRILAVIAGAAATHRSRWYVTPAFSTVLVFLLLLHASPEAAGTRFVDASGRRCRASGSPTSAGFCCHG
jgi:hypothetical protein